MIACIQAWQRGEEIQIETHTGWFGVIDPKWEFATCRYRIAPKPKEKKLRPWKPEEVPVGALMRIKGHEYFAAIIEANTTKVCYGRYGDITYDRLDECEHSNDGGKTWKPCGVEVEE